MSEIDEKKVWTIHIYRDAEPDDKKSSSSQDFPLLRATKIVLRPNGKDKDFGKLINSNERELTILAHELGHFLQNMWSGIQLAQERGAWDWARKILPGLNRGMEAQALKTYEVPEKEHA